MITRRPEATTTPSSVRNRLSAATARIVKRIASLPRRAPSRSPTARQPRTATLRSAKRVADSGARNRWYSASRGQTMCGATAARSPGALACSARKCVPSPAASSSAPKEGRRRRVCGREADEEAVEARARRRARPPRRSRAADPHRRRAGAPPPNSAENVAAEHDGDAVALRDRPQPRDEGREEGRAHVRVEMSGRDAVGQRALDLRRHLVLDSLRVGAGGDGLGAAMEEALVVEEAAALGARLPDQGPPAIGAPLRGEREVHAEVLVRRRAVVGHGGGIPRAGNQSPTPCGPRPPRARRSRPRPIRR